jgi:hypothetical protein
VDIWIVAGGNVIAALIAGIGVVTAAVIAKQGVESYREQKQIDGENYRQQREIDRREELAKRQRAEYERYFELFWLLQNLAPGSEDHKAAHVQYNSARDNLSFYASDDGLNKVNEFHKYIVEHPTSEDKNLDTIKTLYAAMIIALRRDCIGETHLTIEELESQLTIST